MTDTTTLAPTDAEIDHLLATHWPAVFAVTEAVIQWRLRHAVREAIAKWGAPVPASGELVAEVMFDERKYIQYTIPLELLPVGAKFYTAQEARVPLTSEQQRCIAEAHNVAACEAYFTARPHVDCSVNRRIFEAGFSKGYGITAAQKETPCAPTP